MVQLLLLFSSNNSQWILTNEVSNESHYLKLAEQELRIWWNLKHDTVIYVKPWAHWIKNTFRWTNEHNHKYIFTWISHFFTRNILLFILIFIFQYLFIIIFFSIKTGCSLIDFYLIFFWCNHRNFQNHGTLEVFREKKT